MISHAALRCGVYGPYLSAQIIQDYTAISQLLSEYTTYFIFRNTAQSISSVLCSSCGYIRRKQSIASENSCKCVSSPRRQPLRHAAVGTVYRGRDEVDKNAKEKSVQSSKKYEAALDTRDAG